nr:nucleoside kinase [Desulfuromonadales bacterium]
MRQFVRQDIPIERRKIAFADAMARLEAEKQWDKYNLLRFRNPPKVVIYTCDGFSDLAHGPLADRTAALSHFKLIPYA